MYVHLGVEKSRLSKRRKGEEHTCTVVVGVRVSNSNNFTLLFTLEKVHFPFIIFRLSYTYVRIGWMKSRILSWVCDKFLVKAAQIHIYLLFRKKWSKKKIGSISCSTFLPYRGTIFDSNKISNRWQLVVQTPVKNIWPPWPAYLSIFEWSSYAMEVRQGNY